MNNKIKCPDCGYEFEVSESITKEVEAHLKAEFEAKLKDGEKKFVELQKTIAEEKERAAKDFELKLKAEKEGLWKIAQEKAKEKQDLEFKDLQQQLKEKEEQVRISNEKEMEFRKKQRELEEKSKNLELEVQRKLDEESKKITEEVSRKLSEEQRMKMLEKDKQLEQMRVQIEDLRRKSEQGSMQIQGDVQENDIKILLQNTFPIDLIEDVPTGINGADLVHTVNSQNGLKMGIILWESKNTKTFNQEWVQKLKDDQIRAKADIAVIVTRALPEGIETFTQINGVWVCDVRSIIPLTHAIRQQLTQVSQIKNSFEGRDEKMNILFKYLSGSQFKNRIENIVKTFVTMKDDLEKERRAMKKHWAKRETEIERIVENTVGFYGDLQGVIGTSLPRVEALELESDTEVE